MAPLLITGAIELAKAFLPGMVGKIAGDKSGEVAGKVLEVAGQVVGVPVNQDNIGSVQAAFAKNPELAAQFQTHLADLDAELTKAFLQDVADARSRDVEMRKSGQQNIRADAMVIAAFVAVVVISVFLIMASDVDTEVLVFLTTIGGMLMKNISTAFDFEFGSSRGSKNKDADMGGLLKLLGGK